uniref:Uncharacterized protein n=1 Tax=Lepeophtheirus salmonis TaxID=72036 RepID=A0A0K2V2L6_LEPSM
MKSFSLAVLELQFGFKSIKTNPSISQCYYYNISSHESRDNFYSTSIKNLSSYN